MAALLPTEEREGKPAFIGGYHEAGTASLLLNPSVLLARQPPTAIPA